MQLTLTLDGVTPSELHDQVEANLRALDSSRDSLVQANVRVALMQLLAGSGEQAGMTRNAQFEPPVQLEEEICLALGRARSPEATLVLLELLQNRDHDFRAWACLGLGLAGEAEHASSLVPYLMDERPFVRLCAWRSLKHLTGQDFFADWLYGERLEISRAAEQYFAWIARNG